MPVCVCPDIVVKPLTCSLIRGCRLLSGVASVEGAAEVNLTVCTQKAGRPHWLEKGQGLRTDMATSVGVWGLPVTDYFFFSAAVSECPVCKLLWSYVVDSAV